MGLKGFCDVLGGGAHRLVFDIRGGDDDVERGDGGGQPEAIFIVVLLNGGRQNALDSDAIAPHDRKYFLAVAVEHVGAHRLGVFVAKLEDMTDFDGGIDAERRAAVWASFASGYASQVEIGSGLERLPGSGVLDVVILFISARDQVAPAFEG